MRHALENVLLASLFGFAAGCADPAPADDDAGTSGGARADAVGGKVFSRVLAADEELVLLRLYRELVLQFGLAQAVEKKRKQISAV